MKALEFLRLFWRADKWLFMIDVFGVALLVLMVVAMAVGYR